MLVIVIDFENGFTGSTYAPIADGDTDDEIEAFLKKKFPGTTFDNVLFVKNDKIVREWFGGKRN